MRPSGLSVLSRPIRHSTNRHPLILPNRAFLTTYRPLPIHHPPRCKLHTPRHPPSRSRSQTCNYSPLASPSLSPGALSGKTALITGASRGIGAAIAQRFAAEGARCVLVGRDEVKLKSVLEGLEQLGREGDVVDHVVWVGDVGEGEFWRGLRREKPIDILVNAAGVTHYSPLFATTEQLLEKIVQTNLTGTMLGCKIIGKIMMGNDEGGCIINVASLLGLKGGKGSAGYAASKAGVIGFTRALAAEVGKAAIRVNVIVPGYIETDMTASMTAEARSGALDAIPLKRFGEASEIADAAVFLATNKYTNNCVLNLDGGLSAM